MIKKCSHCVNFVVLPTANFRSLDDIGIFEEAFCDVDVVDEIDLNNEVQIASTCEKFKLLGHLKRADDMREKL